jgi:anaerobic magnesium-protoporphyrin IX monomethyl ester cyclase
MSKLVLINPWSQDEEGTQWSFEYQKNYWRNPYLGLVQLATYLQHNGHQVKIIDCERDLLIEAFGNTDLLLQIVESRIRNLCPDVVGLTGMTYRWPQAYKLLHHLAPLKSELGFKLILGGRHAMAESEMCLQDVPALDAVFYGLAEVGLKKYLDGSSLEQVPGVLFFENGVLRKTDNCVIEELDDLPWPDWSMVDASFYTHPCIHVHRSINTPLRSLDTACSRGCLMACGFCSGTDGKPRWHSVEYVLDYIVWTQKNYGTNATIFQDTSLGNNRDFLVGLCEGLIKRGMHKNLIWTANMRANQVDRDIVELMYRAGCRLVFIGFESGSDRMLKLMSKGCTVSDNIACARTLEEAQIPYWASFIVGYPGETEQDIIETVRLVKSMKPTTGWANAFFPSPGSPIYNHLKRQGLIKIDSIDDWANYSKTGDGDSIAGKWSAMPEPVFRHYLSLLQTHFLSVTEQGLCRNLEFSV